VWGYGNNIETLKACYNVALSGYVRFQQGRHPDCSPSRSANARRNALFYTYSSITCSLLVIR
jgi:hypothetical protein